MNDFFAMMQAATQAQSNAMQNQAGQYQNQLNQYLGGLGQQAQGYGGYFPPPPPPLPPQKPKEKTMFQEIVTDVKGFVKEHRGFIYFVAVALLVDHFVFNGAFKERLKAMAEKLVGKIEQKIEDAK